MSKLPLAVAVLAGGQSQRMGSDKAAIRVHGNTLLDKIVSVTTTQSLFTAVVGRQRPEWWTRTDIVFIPDDEQGLGPISGVATALNALHSFDILVLPCDAVALESEALSWLVSLSTVSSKSIVASIAGEIQPLFAIYRQCDSESISREKSSGTRSLRTLAKRLDFGVEEVPETLIAQFTCANTRGELARFLDQQ